MTSLLPIQGDVIINDKTSRISWMFTDFENVIAQLTCLIVYHGPCSSMKNYQWWENHRGTGVVAGGLNVR